MLLVARVKNETVTTKADDENFDRRADDTPSELQKGKSARHHGDGQTLARAAVGAKKRAAGAPPLESRSLNAALKPRLGGQESGACWDANPPSRRAAAHRGPLSFFLHPTTFLARRENSKGRKTLDPPLAKRR